VPQLTEFEVGGGQSIFFEFEDSAAGPVTYGIGPQSIATRGAQAFEEAISCVRPGADELVAQLRNLASAPDEVVVGSGLVLSMGAGAFIVAATTPANLKVLLARHRAGARDSHGGHPVLCAEFSAICGRAG
jgi:Trypsin-co-occurring domain 1